MMVRVIYDAGALIAADRNEKRFWLAHRARLELRIVPDVPSVVLAQVSRSRAQVSLARMLKGCIVSQFDETSAHAVGRLLKKSNTSDVIDAAVVARAAETNAAIVTSDPDDLEHLAAALDQPVSVLTV